MLVAWEKPGKNPVLHLAFVPLCGFAHFLSLVFVKTWNQGFSGQAVYITAKYEPFIFKQQHDIYLNKV